MDNLYTIFFALTRIRGLHSFPYLPVLPVFGKGDTRFQPVYVGDIGLLVEILTRNSTVKVADGKIIEAAGPDGKFILAQL